MKDVLIINSYAGSLLLGCKAAGFPVRGSYEDSGFGIEAQKLNFPGLDYVDRLPWPQDDLFNTVVIAHPPCAGFSNQAAGHGGVDSAHFKCHAQVMDYALPDCEALAIESVCGAFKAADTYQKYAKRYGYNFFMLKLNSASFGVPQWRPRAWMIFLRDQDLLTVNFKPVYKTVESIVEPTRASDHCTIKDQTYLAMRFKKAGFNFQEFIKHDSIGSFDGAAAEWLEVDREEVAARTGTEGLFRVRLPRKLDLVGFAPTLLEDSLWYVNGRPLLRKEYQRIMGFPDSFKWPEKLAPQFRKYLSKGVCPPVAAWILEQLSQRGVSFSHSCRPGELLDLNPKQARALDAARQMEIVL